MKDPKARKPKHYGENVVVSLDRELKDWLAEQAKREDRPVGQMARVLLKEAREARASTQQNTR